MPRLPLLALVLLAVPAEDGEVRTSRGRAVDQEEPPRSQHVALEPLRPLGDGIRLGESFFAFEDGGRPRIATTDGSEPGTPLREGREYGLAWTAGGDARRTPVRFVFSAEHGWRWFVAQAVVHTLGEETIRLIDGDGDGTFGELDVDGFCAGDSNSVAPLRARMVLGTEVVELAAVSPDGLRLSASVTAVEGTRQQLECLRAVNRLRAANGLPTVTLDPVLSAACTEHAEYLALHDWDGVTDPHVQGLGPEGASEAGREAAARSNVVRAAPLDSVAEFWLTYFHRVPLMQPALTGLGVNASPEDLTVLDAGGAMHGPVADPWPWSKPVVVPAPGATGIPLNANGELPLEPVPDLGSRGFPVVLVFPRTHPPLEGFTGSLVRVAGRSREPVPVLVAAQGGFDFAYGIVPEEPLERDSTYEARLVYTLNGQRHELVVPFRTVRR